MTIYTPSIEGRPGPLYRAIADAVEEDIRSGSLPTGSRLPPQRELADRLGVTLTTVTRAYGEAVRRGLVAGHVGRGTFVRETPASARAGASEEWIDLSINSLLPEEQALDLKERAAEILGRPGGGHILDYNLKSGADSHRKAGAEWIGRSGLQADPERVLVTAGAQHAMLVSLATLTRPGETILVEDLTYSGMKLLAHFLRVRLRGVAMDEEGIIPDALEEACRRDPAKVLYCMPTIQNPTAAMMPEARRRRIAEIARRHELSIVEDDTYGFLCRESPPLSVFAPERSCYITSTSKSLAPATRVGFLTAPGTMIEELSAAIFATALMASPLMAEVVSEWIRDGTADRLVDWKRREAAARQAIAARVLARFDFRAHAAACHLWLRLPRPWRAGELVQQAREAGILLSSPEDFAVGPEGPSDALRICLGPPRNRSALEGVLRTLVEVLDRGPVPTRSVI